MGRGSRPQDANNLTKKDSKKKNTSEEPWHGTSPLAEVQREPFVSACPEAWFGLSGCHRIRYRTPVLTLMFDIDPYVNPGQY